MSSLEGGDVSPRERIFGHFLGPHRQAREDVHCEEVSLKVRGPRVGWVRGEMLRRIRSKVSVLVGQTVRGAGQQIQGFAVFSAGQERAGLFSRLGAEDAMLGECLGPETEDDPGGRDFIVHERDQLAFVGPYRKLEVQVKRDRGQDDAAIDAALDAKGLEDLTAVEAEGDVAIDLRLSDQEQGFSIGGIPDGQEIAALKNEGRGDKRQTRGG